MTQASKGRLGQRGDTGRGVFSCIIALGVFIYAAILFGEPHYNHYALSGKAGELIELDLKSEDEIRSRFMEEVNRLGANIEPEAVQVVRERGKSTLIAVSWSEDVSLFGYYITTYNFNIRAGGTKLAN